MGHIDHIKSLNPELPREINLSKITQFLRSSEINKTTATNHLHQALRFIYDAKKGDLVLTVDFGSLALGRITSDAYFKKEDLIVKTGKGKREKDSVMDHYLRRKVEWITSLSRSKLPYKLSRGITGHQTFFSLDEYEAQIYSMVSPFVYKDNSLTTNLLIRRKEDISTYQFSKLTAVFLKAEFLAKQWEELSKVKNEVQLEKLFEEYCSLGNSDSSLIAEFSSPGRTSNLAKLPFGRATLFALVLGMFIRGGKLDVMGFRAELHGMITDEADTYFLEKMTDEALTLFHKWLIKDAKEVNGLDLKTPGAQIDLAELEKK